MFPTYSSFKSTLEETLTKNGLSYCIEKSAIGYKTSCAEILKKVSVAELQSDLETWLQTEIQDTQFKNQNAPF